MGPSRLTVDSAISESVSRIVDVGPSIHSQSFCESLSQCVNRPSWDRSEVIERYRRSPRPPAVRAHSRQSSSHDKTFAAERLARYATPGALHLRKCQQFGLEHSQIPFARERAAAFISSLNAGRALRRCSLPTRGFARRSSMEESPPSGGNESVITPILPLR